MSLIRVGKSFSYVLSRGFAAQSTKTHSLASVTNSSPKYRVFSRYFASSTPSSSMFSSIFGSGSTSNTAPNSTNPASSRSASSPSSNSSSFNDFDDSVMAKEYETLKKKNYDFSEGDSRYAYLLYSLFKTNNALNLLDSELAKLEKEYLENPQFKVIIHHEGGDDKEVNLSDAERELALEVYLETDGSKFHEITRGFLSLCAINNRLDELGDIVAKLEKLREVLNDKTSALIVTARSLTDAEKANTIKALETTFNKKNITIREKIDPNLNGGFEIFYDNFHLDNSSETQEKEIEEELSTSVNGYLTEVEDREV